MSFPEPIGDAPFNDRDKLRQSFTGSWHVAYSTSKLWTDGKQLRPIFKYEPSDGSVGKSPVLNDVSIADEIVNSSVNPPLTKPKAMEGTSTQDDAEFRKFRWRGNGWAKLFSLDWRIVYHNVDKGIAATCFTKTFYADAACNILVRDASNVSTEAVDQAKKAISKWPGYELQGPLKPASGTSFTL